MKLVWTEKASRDALSIHADISEHSETYADSVSNVFSLVRIN